MASRTELFSPIVKKERLHPQFIELLGSSIHSDARALMTKLLQRRGDPNGNFIRDFQGEGFHARVFELACFAYLEEAGFSIDRTYESPDFMCSKGGYSIAIEAVTANPSGGQGADISLQKMAPLNHHQLLEKVSRELPGRIGKSLHKKLKNNYHDLPHCRDEPLVFMIAPYFEAGSNFYTDDALFYPLFGAPEGAPNEIHPFFLRDEAEAVSAVVYCNQFTVSRFFRLATDFRTSGPTTTRSGVFYRSHSEEETALCEFSHQLGAPGLPQETWAEGVTVFENPNARIPLPRGALPATSFVFVEDGFVTREVGEFHPVVSFTRIE